MVNHHDATAREFGVTLIELLVVIAILALVTATVAPSFIRAVNSARFNAGAREIVNALKTARHSARRERREVALTLDTDSLTYELESREQPISTSPGTRLMLVTAASEQTDASTGAIRFFPDGSSTGGTVTLDDGRRIVSIAVDWLTGRVTLN